MNQIDEDSVKPVSTLMQMFKEYKTGFNSFKVRFYNMRKIICLIIGLFSIISFPLASLLISYLTREISTYYIIVVVLYSIIRGIGFYLFYTLTLFGVCKLFQGKGKIEEFFFEIGVSFVPLIFVSFVVSPLALFYMNEFGLGRASDVGFITDEVTIFAFMCGFLFFLSILWMGLLSSSIISEKLELSKIKSVLIFVVTSLPSFFVYTSIFNLI